MHQLQYIPSPRLPDQIDIAITNPHKGPKAFSLIVVTGRHNISACLFQPTLLCPHLTSPHLTYCLTLLCICCLPILAQARCADPQNRLPLTQMSSENLEHSRISNESRPSVRSSREAEETCRGKTKQKKYKSHRVCDRLSLHETFPWINDRV
jgi:hypothetical protein